MSLAELVDHVIGVDPDRDRITAAVVCARTQGEIASKSFATTARGYGQAMRWAKDHTTDGRRAWSIESTGSGPYPRILDTGCDYAAGRSVAV